MDNRISLLRALRPDTPVGRFQLGGLLKAVEERENLKAVYDELVQIAGGMSRGGMLRGGMLGDENEEITATVIDLIVMILTNTGYWKFRKKPADNSDAHVDHISEHKGTYGGQSFLPQAINFAIVIVIAVIFIFIGGACSYMHSKTDDTEKNPLYFALGIAFAGAGGSIISHAAMGVMIPPVIRNMIQNTKANGRI